MKINASSAIAAVLQTACFWLGQLVHVENTTVVDVSRPPTVVVGPMKTQSVRASHWDLP